MRLYAQVIDSKTIQLSWDNVKIGKDWYEIEREPDFLTEILRYDSETDSVVIEKRVKTLEQTAAEQKAAEDAALFKPDTIRALQEKIAELEGRLTKVEERKI
jgi:hypothetical protein